MAAKLDQTAESICGPKWAIARDLTVYESNTALTTTGGKVTADRGPPMVCFRFHRSYPSDPLLYRFGLLLSVVI